MQKPVRQILVLFYRLFVESTSTFHFVAWCVSLSVVNKNKLNIFSANPEWEKGKRRGAPE